MNNDSKSIFAYKRELLAAMTPAESTTAKREYGLHVKGCLAIKVDPSPWPVWLLEWLECRRLPAVSADGAELASNERRDYNRMYEGKRGFEP